MIELEEQIINCRSQLQIWLRKAYGPSYGDFYGEQDISYDGWKHIEGVLKLAFEAAELGGICRPCIEDILFFISRSDEGGRIIAWLTPRVGPLSHIADLNRENFIILCRCALNSGEDFCDYQLAACFSKFEHLDDVLEELLIGFFNKKASYTKQLALLSMAKHRVAYLLNFISELWAGQDEWAGLTCLAALKESGCNVQLFEQYRDILLRSSDKTIRDSARKITIC